MLHPVNASELELFTHKLTNFRKHAIYRNTSEFELCMKIERFSKCISQARQNALTTAVLF